MRSERKDYRHALTFISEMKNKNGIVAMLATMYNDDNITDGYIQRVFAIDNDALNGIGKLYFEHVPDIDQLLYERVDELHMIIKVNLLNELNVKVITGLFKKCRVVYAHSVFRCSEWELNPQILKWLVQNQVFFIVDMHGAVPEEIAMQGHAIIAHVHQKTEEIVMAGANRIICVNHAMQDHYLNKYRYLKQKPQFIVMPIFPPADIDRETIANKVEAYEPDKVKVVYAGGMQKWQNIALMQDVIEKLQDKCSFNILTGEVDSFLALYGDRKGNRSMFVRKATPKEVKEINCESHYGFALRDNTIVNNVACPTKMIEYIQQGVVPILKSDRIGDFLRNGLKYMHLDAFSKGKFFSKEEYEKAVFKNLQVLDRFSDDYEKGKKELLDVIKGEIKR